VPNTLSPGENRAVDAAVVDGTYLLLIRRGDGGGWAIPGGMVESGENDAARDAA
jgi:ADP-ribose pyrophosphatase YjhB (NUDIX family)